MRVLSVDVLPCVFVFVAYFKITRARGNQRQHDARRENSLKTPPHNKHTPLRGRGSGDILFVPLCVRSSCIVHTVAIHTNRHTHTHAQCVETSSVPLPVNRGVHSLCLLLCVMCSTPCNNTHTIQHTHTHTQTTDPRHSFPQAAGHSQWLSMRKHTHPQTRTQVCGGSRRVTVRMVICSEGF